MEMDNVCYRFPEVFQRLSCSIESEGETAYSNVER